jgi:hypothetical protein
MSTCAGVLRRAHWLVLLALGCSSERRASPDSGRSDATCSVVRHVEVPLDPFGDLTDPPALVPFGDRFGVVDDESITLGRTAAVALVSWQGIDEQDEFQLTELCPDDVCRNVHGTSVLGGVAGSAEFLLAEQGSATSMPSYPLRALAWDVGQSEAAMTPLFDSRVTAITTRADLKSSRDAARALFVLGNIDMPSLESVEIGAGAVLVAPPDTMALPDAPWDCVSVVPTDEAGALSVVTKLDGGSEVVWSVRELDAAANVVFETSVTVPIGDAVGYSDCPSVVESPAGFHAQWVSAEQASVIATVARAADPAATTDLLSLETSPGALQGLLQGEFLFRAQLDDEHPGFLRLKADGTPGGPTLTLPPLPASTLEHRRAPPEVLLVKDSTVEVSYELDSARVFEELDCP